MLRVASEFSSISIFALNLVTGLGLGLAIDYSLFIVSRYREEIARSGPGLEAMRRTMATAGRTILFSSLTVAAALASLADLPPAVPLLDGGRRVACGADRGRPCAGRPARRSRSCSGPRVNALAPAFLQRRAEREAQPMESGFWYRLSRFVMRRPAPIAVASAGGADRPRDPVLRDQHSPAWTPRCSHLGERPPGRHALRVGVPAASGTSPIRARGPGRRGPARRGSTRRGRSGSPASPPSAPATARRRGVRGRRDLRVRPAQRAAARTSCNGFATCRPDRRRPGDGLHRPLRRPSVEPGGPPPGRARSRRRSRPSWSCS